MQQEFSELREKKKTNYEAYRNSSDFLLRDKTTDLRKSGLTEYEESKLDQKEDKEIKGVYHSKNKTGSVSFGKIDKNQMLITIGATKPYDTKGKEKDSKIFKKDGSRKIRQSPGEIRTNSHEPKDSAVLIKTKYEGQSPERILKNLKRLAYEKDTYVERALPFLNEKKQVFEKARLMEMRNSFKGAKEKEVRETIEADLERVENDMQHREREERRFLDQIKHSVGRMKDEDKKTKQEWKKKIMLDRMQREEADESTPKEAEDANDKKKKRGNRKKG